MRRGLFAIFLWTLLSLVGCGEIRSANQTPDAVPKISIETQSWPYEHLGKTLDDVQLTASLNTEERGLDRYLLTVHWTEPANFPLFTWSIYFRYGTKIKRDTWTPGNGPRVTVPFTIELTAPLPDAVEFRLLTHTDSLESCELNPKENCPLVRAILFR